MKRSHKNDRKNSISCKTAEDWLSEALDERLSASETRAFRAHILSCRNCRKALDRLKALSSWTDALPRQTVSQSFSKTLQRRIASGEGSPVAALMSPVPMFHKFKFFLSGAVTAAAVLLGFFLLFDGLRSKKESGEPLVAEHIQSAATEIENMKREFRNVKQDPVMTLQQLKRRGDSASARIRAVLKIFQGGPFALRPDFPGFESLHGAEAELEKMKHLFEQYGLPQGFSSMGNNRDRLLKEIEHIIVTLPSSKEIRIWIGGGSQGSAGDSAGSSSTGRLKPVPGQSRNHED